MSDGSGHDGIMGTQAASTQRIKKQTFQRQRADAFAEGLRRPNEASKRKRALKVLEEYREKFRSEAQVYDK